MNDSDKMKCRFCEESATRLMRHDRYTLYMCATCRAQFWLPMENPGAAWYERDERYADRNVDPILKPNKKHRGALEFLKGRRGRVLDVGCGVGNFLALAEKQGWKGWGIDFDHDAIRAAQRTFGLKNLEVADLGTFIARHPDLQFDLVTFFDVFEHIDNHNEFIEQVSSIIPSGGFIALSMPYRHGWRWLMPHDLPPRHLTRWDEDSLRNFLERHGFTVRLVKRLPAGWYFLVMKLRYNFGKWSSFGLVRRVSSKSVSSDDAAKVRSATQQPMRIRAVKLLAKAKDSILFGIPAAILWVVLLPTRKRYTDFYVVAKKNQ